MRAADVFRVLVTTDSHLGYKERDATLGQDAFDAFEECLQLAEQFEVDLLLHAGDLFDSGSPSQLTLYKTFELLSRYCLGQKRHAFVHERAPNARPLNVDLSHKVSVKLPIFTIHGNPDPPLALGGQRVSSIDVLAQLGLLNDVGHAFRNAETSLVQPVVLRKGASALCLYGLSHTRDEALNELLRSGRLTFLAPTDRENSFCVLLLHQNRFQNGCALKKAMCLDQTLIPQFIDLVVWGHEHECCIVFAKSENGSSFVTQPGSTVITALRQPETVPKSALLLERFNGVDFLQHTRNYWWASYVGTAIYLLALYFGTQFMQRRKAFNNLNGLLKYWNLTLAIFSFIGCTRILPYLLYYMYRRDTKCLLCVPPQFTYGRAAPGLWTAIFVYSKYLELFDTAFIVLRKKPLSFLHWYHHATVLVFTWLAYVRAMPAGVFFVSMNYFVHSCMYFYYYLASCGRKPQWGMILTIFQITQMICGCVIVATYAMYMAQSEALALSNLDRVVDVTAENLCAKSAVTMATGAIIYGSYLYLFTQFFINRYLSKRKKN
uniref:Elongation of fatty acids protein 1-like n=1 Tax=Dermatophagoides pteronyssinus TaxID=6956 RepID=A0A6P6YKZ8_DERPT|nr:elongation of fatty acids protein 1-like [Dermatophagoides pteronyssinus]